jgi:malate dehydrogenase (oxaloacetate-decarboxylating)(NADP+)
MVAQGDADAMVSGVTRSFGTTFDEVTRVLDATPGERLFGLSIFLSRTRTVFIADTTVHELPTPEELADIAIQTARKAREFGHEPRVALLSFSNFGNPLREKAERVRQAINELDDRKVLSRREVDFEYDGEMQADVALSYELMQARYPFCRLSGAANVLIMPALHSANISAKLLQHLGGGTVIGPILMGLAKPAQIVQTGATVSDLVTAAAFAAFDAMK